MKKMATSPESKSCATSAMQFPLGLLISTLRAQIKIKRAVNPGLITFFDTQISPAA